MNILPTMPETTMLEELGRRIQQQRVGMNLTQVRLAEASGVSARTIERLEAGTSVQLDKMVRILRALDLSVNLNQLVPDFEVRPLQLADSKSIARHRAYTRKHPGSSADRDWVWGDKK